MTALSLSSGSSHLLELNWPRISAYSGSFSLHLLLALLLLIPPVAMQLRHAREAPPILADIVSAPPEVKPEPALPQPLVHLRAAPKPPHPQITITAPVANPLPVMAAPVDSIAAPGAGANTDKTLGDGTTDAAPSALAYGNRTKIAYPHEAWLRHEQGTVMLRVLVGADGQPQQIEIEHSSGSHVLDNAARDAVKRWSFKPGMRGGVAYAAWALVPISFNLSQ